MTFDPYQKLHLCLKERKNERKAEEKVEQMNKQTDMAARRALLILEETVTLRQNLRIQPYQMLLCEGKSADRKCS